MENLLNQARFLPIKRFITESVACRDVGAQRRSPQASEKLSKDSNRTFDIQRRLEGSLCSWDYHSYETHK